MKPQTSDCPYPLEDVFSNLKPFLTNPSPFSNNDVEGLYDAFFETIPTYEILVVGAGGLGCQIVKNLAVSGIRNIHLIDMDTIDLTNLNRQFLFRQKDVGRMKAEVVAEFVMRRCPGVKIIPHTKRVQEMDFDFYTKFNVIVGGLDNVQARKFLNAMVFQINRDEESTVCYYIDGATEGFHGQCLFVEPYKTACYSCSLLDGLQEKAKVNYCTIANTPRTPEHCIQYVLEIEWEKQYPHTKRDNDNLEHMNWIYQKSAERAKQFNIEGVTQMLTLGVAKNIIPAIASTNALIAAFCTNEALKAIGDLNPLLKNYFFFKGEISIGSDTYEIQKKQNCSACLMRAHKLETMHLTTKGETTLEEILNSVNEKMPIISKRPFININGSIFYNPVDRERANAKQKMSMTELQAKGIFKENPQLLIATDKSLKSELSILITIE